jgi:class 3 adenylate cyclase
MLDPKIVEALVTPVTGSGELSNAEEDLLRLVAEGRHIKAIAVAQRTTPSAVSDAVEKLFLKLAKQASSGAAGSLRRLRMLHQAIVEREEQGETLSRLLPGGVAEKLRNEGRNIGETETLVVSVLMADVRGYSTIAEDADLSVLARQLNEHRAEMNNAILGQEGTVMQFVGDGTMAVFGAPIASDDHADRALAAAHAMHRGQEAVNARWREAGLAPWGLGIGLTTGEVAAALLGSEARLEYTLVGDTVNLSQRLQQWAEPGETVLSDATYAALTVPCCAELLEPALVKGRHTPVVCYRVHADGGLG